MKRCKDCNNILTLCDCRDNPKWEKIAEGKSERYPYFNRKEKEK